MKNALRKPSLLPIIILAILLLRQCLSQPAPQPTLEQYQSCESSINEGDDLYRQAKFEEAARKYQEALDCSQKIGARIEEGYSLNGIGLVYANQGRYDEALELHDQALTIYREEGVQTGQSPILNNIGTIYLEQDLYNEALVAFEQALLIVRKVGTPVEESAVLNNIGQVFQNQGRYDEALEKYQESISMASQETNPSETGVTLNNIGTVYHAQGRYPQAIEVYMEALTIARDSKDLLLEGLTLDNIGLTLKKQGNFVEALDSYQQSLDIVREIGDRSGEAGTLNNIGGVYQSRGQYAQALDYYQRAQIIAHEIGEQVNEGIALNNIGIVYKAQGRFEQAFEAYQQALIIVQKAGDRAGEGGILNNIGLVYKSLGNYEKALTNLQQALTIRQEIGDQAGTAETRNNIATIYEDQQDFDKAIENYQQALTLAQKLGFRDGEGTTLHNIGHLYANQQNFDKAMDMLEQALDIHQEVGNQLMEGKTLENIGGVYQAQGHYDDALAYYRQAIDIFENMRASAGSEQGRATFIAQYASLYSQTVALSYYNGQYEDVFFTSERNRARAFLDSIATGYVELTDNEAQDLYEQELGAYIARQSAQDALIRVHAVDPNDQKLIADLEAQLVAADADYAAVLAEIEEREDQLAALVPGRSTVLTLLEVQALLDDGVTMVYFIVLEEQTLVFLITHDGFEVVEIEVTGENLAARVQHFRALIGFKETDATRQEAQTLYQLLFAPLAPSIHTDRLIIVPHGALHYLPFAALFDEESGQYLIENYELVILPSASTLPFIQENAVDADSSFGIPLILGNPTTNDASLPSLPFAEQEAQAIAVHFGFQPLLGKKATENAVWEQAADATILHLAAHGRYNPTNPLYSSIELAPGEGEDGRLEVHEIYGLNLHNTDLVVLSACQTQLGELSAGDELVGLTRAFFFAGAPSVIATLWNVDDQATSLLMERFYTHLNRGMGKAAALRQAQLDIAAQFPDPYYWAGFVLSGDGGS